MEELFVYALLCSEGFDMWVAYADTLDTHFMENSDNDDYLSLEEMTLKESVIHCLSLMYQTDFDADYFGKILMSALQQIYEAVSLESFAGKMYSVWNKLPRRINKAEPFFTLCYADDCLSYGDQYQCRQLYEQAMHYYD